MSFEPARRVLIMVENLPVPLDRRVWLEATSLLDAGYQVSVICPQGRGWTAPYELREGVHIYRFAQPAEAHSGALAYAREWGGALWHMIRLARKVRRELDGQNRLPEIIQGVEFRDGIKHEIKAA